MAASLLSRLRNEGLTVFQAGEKLVVRPRELLTAEKRGLIRDHKAQLLDELAADSRREELLSMLNASPAVQRVFLADTLPNGGGRISLAVRGIGTCELLIPAGRFDPLEIIKLFDKLNSEHSVGGVC